jgi:hypothetical protein
VHLLDRGQEVVPFVARERRVVGDDA